MFGVVLSPNFSDLCVARFSAMVSRLTSKWIVCVCVFFVVVFFSISFNLFWSVFGCVFECF